MTIRHYRKDDIPAMRALWQRVFNEREAYLDAVFALLPDIGGAAVATDENGVLIGAAYAMTGFELLTNGREGPHVGYIYAVAVDESVRGRGIGAALTRAAAEICREREAVIITTLPAEDSLYPWYEKQIGTNCLLYLEKRTVSARKTLDIMKLTGTEYMLWRENMLRGKAHIRLSTPMMEAQRALCEAYDGGLYASSDGIFAAFRDGEQLIILEVLCVQGSPEETAASAAAYLNCREAVYYMPAEGPDVTSGTSLTPDAKKEPGVYSVTPTVSDRVIEPYVVSDTPLPPGTVWNLTLD